MRVDTIYSKIGIETDKSMDGDITPNMYIEFQKIKQEFELEKKLRQKMADKVGELQKQVDGERKKNSELKFIRDNDNKEIIRLED